MTELTHHAYYIEGSLSAFEEYKAALRPLWAQSFERFGIDEARALIQLAALKNFSQTLFLVGAASLTSEAQQALLKLFEEPQPGTTFVLLVPHGSLLPTLRSRMLVYPNPFQGRPLESLTAQRFLAATGKERSEMISKLLEDEEGVKERVLDFVNALEAVCVKRNVMQQAEGRQGLEDIAMVRDYLRDRSPSLKMLLEHLALSLPAL